MLFTNIGIDITGHLWVNRLKRYVLLVTDLVTRAVDLELLENMSTNEIFLAFRRIIARHAEPHFILSNNAPQFQRLEEMYTHDWTWKYNPKFLPWMAGTYKRMMALLKNALFRTFHGYAISDTLLRTALAEIAAMLNQRPLTYVSKALEDQPLTLNDFLRAQFCLLKENVSLTPTTPTAAQLVHLHKQSMEIINHFWSIWRSSYNTYVNREILINFRNK